MAGFGKQRGPHTEGATISDIDGIHTLTCALMLLNTDLHGHVSRGGREGCVLLLTHCTLSWGSPFLQPPSRHLLAGHGSFSRPGSWETWLLDLALSLSI